jgi:hypothetical protein
VRRRRAGLARQLGQPGAGGPADHAGGERAEQDQLGVQRPVRAGTDDDGQVIAKVLVIGAGLALAGVVAVWVTAAVLRVTVTVTVRSVPATWTVTVCGTAAGVSIAAAVVGLPASSVVAGIMLPDCMACCVAEVLAVSAAVPAVVPETFWNLVPPDTSHRCSEPLADCKMTNWFVARTTMPR